MSNDEAIMQLSKEKLEEKLLKNCEICDAKVNAIYELETKVQHLNSRIQRLSREERVAKRSRYKYSDVTSRISKSSVVALQDQLATAKKELEEKRKKRDSIVRQVKYFRRLSLSNSKTQIDEIPSDRAKRLLTDVISKGSMPQIDNNLRASLYILCGDYESAQKYLRILLTDGSDLYDVIDRRYQLEERESQVEEMKGRLAELTLIYKSLAQHQSDLLEQYRQEADLNYQENLAISEMQKDKENREKEAKETQELLVQAKQLSSEIHHLKHQKEKIRKDHEEQEKLAKEQVNQAQLQLEQQLQTIQSEIQTIISANKKLEEEVEQQESKLNQSKERRNQTEEKLQILKSKLKATEDKFTQITKESIDSFETGRSVPFLQQILRNGWSFDMLDDRVKRLDQLHINNKELTQNIEQLKKEREDLERKMKEKRQKISDLEAPLRQLVKTLSSENSQNERPDISTSAEHITFSPSDLAHIKSDEVGIMILFTDFTIGSAYVGKTPSKLFITVDFLNDQSMETISVEPTSGMFNSSLLFILKNDRILYEYLSKAMTPVQLCRIREGSETATAVGSSELNLLPLVDGIEKFSIVISLFSSSGRHVGNVTAEIGVSSPIYKP